MCVDLRVYADALDGLTFTKPDNGNTNNPNIAAGVPGENGAITPYATLKEAITAANDGNTVTLLSNVTLSSVLTVGKTITLDGRGYSLNGELLLGEQATGTQIKNVHFILNKTSKTEGFPSIMRIDGADRVQVTGNTFTITSDAKYAANRSVAINVQPSNGQKAEDTEISGNTFDMADGDVWHFGILLTNEGNSDDHKDPGVVNTTISNNIMLGAASLKNTRFLATYDTATEPRLGVSGVTVTGNKLAMGEDNYTDLLIDFWGGTTGITLSGNEFGAGRMGVLFRAQTFQQGKKTALQENITITGNTFNSDTAVVDNGGIKVSEKSPFIFGGEHADENKFGKNTVPFAGYGGESTLFYGVTYRVYGTDEFESFEAVAKGGTIANIPSKDGYTTNVYVKDGDTVKLFDPSTKVSSNLTLYVTFTSNSGGTVTPSYPSSLEVTSKPNKLEYKIGEQFDSTGMVVKYQNHVLGSDQYTVTLDTSKPGKVKVFITLNSDPTKATSFEVTVVVSDLGVHRLYNKWNGEHFYTANDDEYRSLKKAGWTDEGTAFTMADYGTPVYRLYLPGGKHLFTTSEKERDAVKAAGWRYEGIAFYVRDDGTAKTEVYRLYNPGNGDHLLTTNANERGVLALNKWRVEGTAFQAK